MENFIQKDGQYYVKDVKERISFLVTYTFQSF